MSSDVGTEPPPVDVANIVWLAAHCGLMQDGSYATGPTSADVKKYAAAAINVARTEGVPYVDLFNGIPKAISSWQVRTA